MRANATIADQGDMASLQAAIGDYENTTTVFTSKNKVWCAPATPYAKAQCNNCNKEHWIDTPCAGGPQNSDVGAELRHSSLLKDMLTAMKANTFKRLTHRFQGGKNGLPKHTSHKKVTAAVTKIVADNGTDKTAKKKAKKERKGREEGCDRRGQLQQMAAAEADSSDDDSGTDEEDPLTPVVLSHSHESGTHTWLRATSATTKGTATAELHQCHRHSAKQRCDCGRQVRSCEGGSAWLSQVPDWPG